MRGGSHSTYTQDPTKQRANREHVAKLDEYNLFRLYTEASPDPYATTRKVAAVMIHQNSMSVKGMLRTPLPATIAEDDLAYFTHNTSVYADEVEDALFDDPLLQELLQQPVSDERMTAIRARRSALVLQFIATRRVCQRDPEDGGETMRLRLATVA